MKTKPIKLKYILLFILLVNTSIVEARKIPGTSKEHLGSIDPVTGKLTKSSKPGRDIRNKIS
jgi:hypothetical protein